MTSKYAYHVAPSDVRQDIDEHGLLCGLDQVVYLNSSLKQAKERAENWDSLGEVSSGWHDIYRVEISGLWLNEKGFSLENIPSQALTRL